MMATSNFVTHCLWRMHEGGAERSVALLAKHQKQAGVNVRVVVGQDVDSSLTRKLADAEVPVYSLRMRRGIDVSGAISRVKLLPRTGHLVHFHGGEIGMLTAMLLARVGSRFVYTHRGGQYTHGVKGLLPRVLWAAALRFKFNGKVAISASAQKAMCSQFFIPAERCRIILNALDPDDFVTTRTRAQVRAELGLSQAAYVIGTSANIRKLKRIELLLEACRHLAQEPVICVIIGAGVDMAFYQNMADELGLRNVRFIGHRSDIANYLQSLDLFVMTSGKEEGFGNAPIEAMHLGIPTILFRDLESLSDLCKLAGGINIVSSSQELAERVKLIRSDPELQLALQVAGRDLVSDKFSVKRVVDDYTAYYHEVCGAA